MRIALVVHQFPPEYSTGTETLALSVARQFQKRDHAVAVFTTSPVRVAEPGASPIERYEIEGLPVSRFVRAPAVTSPAADREYRDPEAGARFGAFLDEFHPDVVHFFHFARLGVTLIDEAHTRGIPSYFTPTDFWFLCPTLQLTLEDGQTCDGPTRHAGNCVRHLAGLSRIGIVARLARITPAAIPEAINRLDKKLHVLGSTSDSRLVALARRRVVIAKSLAGVRRLFAPTRKMAGLLAVSGIKGSRIIQSAYGIDLDFIDQGDRTEGPVDKLVVGFIGTLMPHKGCHIAIEAFRSLDASRFELQIHGRATDDPAYFQQLEAASRGLDSVRFFGPFPGSDIGRVLSQIDVLVVPSLWQENTPLVVLSALAAKRPVLASDVAGITEVIQDGVNGLLFPMGDAAQLEEDLQSLLNPESLTTLKSGCKPPKSSSQYARELLDHYAVDRKKART